MSKGIGQFQKLVLASLEWFNKNGNYPSAYDIAENIAVVRLREQFKKQHPKANDDEAINWALDNWDYSRVTHIAVLRALRSLEKRNLVEEHISYMRASELERHWTTPEMQLLAELRATLKKVQAAQPPAR